MAKTRNPGRPRLPAALLAASIALLGCVKQPRADDEPEPAPEHARFDAGGLRPIDRPEPNQPIPARLHEPGTWRQVQLGDGSTPNEKKCLEVTGSVVTEDGRPAAGSRVVLISYCQLVGATSCGADGRFSFGEVDLPSRRSGPPSIGPLVLFRIYAYAADRTLVVASENAYVDAPRPEYAKSGGFYQGEKIDVPIKHGPAAKVRGRLVDSAGRPVPGASVRIVSTWPRSGATFSNEGWEDPGLLRAAGADGFFLIANLPRKCRFTIEISAPGFARTQAIADTDLPSGGEPGPSVAWNPTRGDVWSITLLEPLAQHVQVLDAESLRPLAGFDVVAVPYQPTPIAISPRACARTDANGYATLWLPPGPYDLSAGPGDNKDYEGNGLLCQFDATTVGKPEKLAVSRKR